MSVKPGTKNSPIQVKQPTAAKPTGTSPGMKKLVEEAQKLPGQVKAMSAAIKPAAAASKPAGPAKPAKK